MRRRRWESARCFLVVCHNLIGYFREYKQIEPYITSFRYIKRMLDAAEKMGHMKTTGIAGEQERLLACHGKMKSFIRNAYLLVYVEKGERRSAQSYPGLCAYGLLSGSDPV